MGPSSGSKSKINSLFFIILPFKVLSAVLDYLNKNNLLFEKIQNTLPNFRNEFSKKIKYNFVASKAISGQEVSGYSRYSGYLFDWQPIENVWRAADQRAQC